MGKLLSPPTLFIVICIMNICYLFKIKKKTGQVYFIIVFALVIHFILLVGGVIAFVLMFVQ